MYTLSVIIPNYNNAKYLPACIESVLLQNYQNLIEIIIVDDYSTDNSVDVIKMYSEQYGIIKPIFLKENCKVSAARNIGLFQAIGEYVTFLDADDCYYNPNKLNNEMNLIKSHYDRAEECVTYSSIVKMSNDGKEYRFPMNSKKSYMQGNVYRKLLLDINSSLVMRDYCIKREILLSLGGYNESNSLFEDYELLLKISKKIPFYWTEEVGTAYRDSVNGLSKKPIDVLLNAKDMVIKKQLQEENFVNRIIIAIEREIILILKNIYRLINRG